MEKHLLLIFTLLATLFLTSCGDDDCETTCPVGQILTIDCECVTVGVESSTIEVSENIDTDVTWTADNVYSLTGRITVANGATLTIEPGTIIKGGAGAEANSKALVVARGSKINACGTASLPIIMTSVADEISPAMIAAGQFASPNLEPDVQGLWGGLIVLGNAPVSLEGDASEVQIEGIPTSDPNGLYGGSDAADNSGSLCYISIRHGGTNIGEGNEINGLTLGGVGSGTTINNIEVVANRDDGIEWFGGTVNAENLLIWNCGDDGLDTDQAFNGTVRNWIVAVPQGGSAMELDGPEGTLTQGCNNFINGVIYAGANIDHLIDWDDNTNTGVTELYVYGVDADYDPATAFESFGGDGACTSGTWEYTLPAGYAVATFFEGAPAGAATEVAQNANTVGPDASDFGWTWGAQSGTLSSIGL